MSLIEEIREVEQRLVARLRELEPLVAEYNQLRELARSRGIEVPGDGGGENDRSGAPRRSENVSPGPEATRSTPPSPPRDTSTSGLEQELAELERERKDPGRDPDDPGPDYLAALERAQSAASRAGGERELVAKGATRRAARDDGRRQLVREAVAQAPGLTIGELASTLEVEQSALYAIVRSLLDERVVSQRGRRVYPAGV